MTPKGEPMMHRPRTRVWTGILVLTGMLALTATGTPAQAAQPGSAPGSLKMVPANVAFYGASLHYRELIESIGKSRAWAKLMSVPVIKQGIEQAQDQMKNNEQVAQAIKMLDTPENRELLAMLADMFSDEVFSVGSESWSDLVELYTRVNTSSNYGPILQLLQGKIKPEDISKAQGKAIIDTLVEYNKLIKIPDTVFGFHLTDKKKAESQLKRLDDFVGGLIFFVPALQGKYKRVQIGNSSFLSLNFDGSMIPWKELPWEQSGLEEEQIQKLIKILTDLKLSINLGVQGDYMLLNIGGSTKLLERLGGKGDSLVDRPELMPLLKHLDQKVTAISYSSKSFKQSGLTTKEDYQAVKELVKVLLDRADLDAQEKQKLSKEINEQIDASKKYIPELGASLSYTFLTSKGQESYGIEYGKFPGQAIPKPLTLLDHLGGAPLLAGVFRTNTDLDTYKMTTRLMELVWGPLNKVIEANLPGEAKGKYAEVVKAVLPLLTRLDSITQTMFYPALADGQTAIVLDAKMTSNQWHKTMPKSSVALPMLELGLVVGVSDPELFVKSMAEYRKLLEDAVEVVRKQAPMAEIPEFKFPAPREVKKAGTTFYSYSMAEEIGLDKRLMPVIAVGKTVATFTLSQEHAERLLVKKPLHTKDTAFADPNKPLLSATLFDWPGLLDAALPWVEFGVSQAFDEGNEKPKFDKPKFKGEPKGKEEPKFKGEPRGKEEGPKGKDEQPRGKEGPRENPMVKEIMGQVKMVVEVLKVWKGTTSATYTEEGRVVTHTISIIRDLEK